MDDVDRERFRAALKTGSTLHGMVIHGYVLMTNHVHLVVTPQREGALSTAMQAVGRQYVRHFNLRHGRTGTLWEGRFKSSVIDSDRYLLACLRYVENNPVRAGLVNDPAAWTWSSHRHHLGLVADELVSPHTLYWALGNTPFDREQAYRLLFDTAPSAAFEQNLTERIVRGAPIADRAGLDAIRATTGIDLTIRAVGRPRRSQTP